MSIGAAQSPAKITDDLQIPPRFPVDGERRSHALDTPLGIRERAFLLCETHARQDDMGKLGSLIQEDIL